MRGSGRARGGRDVDEGVLSQSVRRSGYYAGTRSPKRGSRASFALESSAPMADDCEENADFSIVSIHIPASNRPKLLARHGIYRVKR